MISYFNIYLRARRPQTNIEPVGSYLYFFFFFLKMNIIYIYIKLTRNHQRQNTMNKTLPIIQTTIAPSQILCKCANKCLCMEMKCDACGIVGIIFHATNLKPAHCFCKENAEQYSIANECRCSKNCICFRI